jgi:outer membrane biosynthesis protein TonB
VVAVILLSLLAHLLFVLAIVLLNKLLPPPKMKDQPLQITSTTLSLEPPPPAPHAAPPPKRMFMPTDAQKNAPHKNTLIESANDNQLQSQSEKARTPDSVMPDITSKVEHSANLKDSPNSPSKEKPHPAEQAAPAQQKQQAQPTPQKSQQTTEKPQQSTQQQPPTPNAQPTKLPPTKSPTQKPATQPQQYDPNGLPVLPALNVPTLAPANPDRQQQQASPAVSMPAVTQDSHGALGTHGANSPEAMATELGKYKQAVYAAIGSYWYPDVDNHFQVLPVGMVHIQFTIHQDGSVSDVKILDGDTGTLQMLRSISLNSILKGAPYGPFTPGMIKEVGESYTDDVSFSIYGQ